MTADVKAGTPAALHAELLAAAGPERVLSLMALRRVLVGRDKAVTAEALRLVLQDGVTLPLAVAASFGVPTTDGPMAPAPSGPDRPALAPPPEKVPAAPGLPAIPAQRAPSPRFTIELGPDSRLDLAALTVRTLRPEAVAAAPSTPTLPTSQARVATDTADASPPSIDALACPSPICSDVPHTHRKVNAMGQIMVDRQMVNALTKFRGEIVTVLLEDNWFRVLHEGRQIAVTPRRHRTGSGKGYGTPD